MDLRGLDIPKIKASVIQKWLSAPELWPAKVLSLARVAELTQQQGGKKLDKLGGYFTCVRAVRGKTPQEMEDLLGFARGYFNSDVAVWKFARLPTAGEFELRGYTQLPGGESFDGIVLRRSDSVRPQFFNKDGTEPTFIPGLAVEQWELRNGVLLPAVEMQRVAAGQRFTNWR